MTPEQERRVALIAIRLGWLRKDKRYKQTQRFKVTPAGRKAFDAAQ